MESQHTPKSCWISSLKNSELGLVDDYALPPVNNPNLKLKKLTTSEAEGLYDAFGEVDAISYVLFTTLLSCPLNEAYLHIISQYTYGKNVLKTITEFEQKAYIPSSRKYIRSVVECVEQCKIVEVRGWGPVPAHQLGVVPTGCMG